MMKTGLLLAACLLLATALFADSTAVVVDSIAIDTTQADTLEVQKPVPMQEQLAQTNTRLNIIRDLLVARLEAKMIEPDSTSSDSATAQDTVTTTTEDDDESGRR